MMVDPLREFDEIVGILSHDLFYGGNSLRKVPKTLKSILGKNRWNKPMWPERVCTKLNETVRFDSFQQFVETAPPRGLGATVQTLKNLCRDDMEALTLIDEAVRRPAHRPKADESVTIINASRPMGTTRDNALRRLRSQRPDLHKRVLDGELSPHAAMIEAGFRRRTFTVPDDPEAAAETLIRRFGKNGTLRLVRAIEALTELEASHEPLRQMGA